MTTKLQAKQIKAEIAALKKSHRQDSSTTAKAMNAIDRLIAQKEKERDRLKTQWDQRGQRREKRIAILEGRL